MRSQGRWSIALALLIMAVGLGPAAGEERDVKRGKQVFMAQGCYGCHMVGTAGTPIGPDLSRVGFKYPESYIARWLRDPVLQKPTAHMPKIDLTEAEVQALSAYLASLQ